MDISDAHRSRLMLQRIITSHAWAYSACLDDEAQCLEGPRSTGGDFYVTSVSSIGIRLTMCTREQVTNLS